MSENLKTIRELAEELGVSKQAIQYHIKYLTNKNRQTNDKGVVVLSHEEQLFIRSRVDKQTNKKQTNRQIKGKQIDKETTWSFTNYLRSELEAVKKNRDTQLAAKDKQIENKDSQISQMQNLLDQQQRLALQDKKLLEEYKAEIKELKSLNMPKQGSEKDDSIPKENSAENRVKEPQNKKWWHFGRRM
ncbi:HTH domain-containing protein [Weissella confusa]|uniref:HTH domain-containing protein n=1 Tax=Weissella confusa TaxID=1583 RepID=UPI0018F21F96|nr:HTH domain-containing protein [Weissella confusa]MBJ7678763.1 HTH domain-containing protein [Weissella confusa]